MRGVRIALTAGAAVLLIAVGAGLGVAVSGSGDDHQSTTTAASPTTGDTGSSTTPGAKNATPGKV